MKMELPELYGSEKQIAWANKIRADALKEIEHVDYAIRFDFPNRPADIVDGVLADYKKKCENIFKTRTNAADWIDNKGNPLVSKRTVEKILMKRLTNQ